MFKWNTLCIYIVCAFLSGNAGGQMPPDESNDSFDTATTIKLGVPISGTLGIGDTDYFRINVASTVDVSIFTESTIDTIGWLSDGSRTFLTFDDDSGNDDNFLIRGRLYVDTYYITVRSFRGLSVGAYTLTVQTDTITDIHSDTTATATPISLGDSINGELHSGDVDYFRIEVTSTVDVSIFTEGTIDTIGWLSDGSFPFLAFDDDAGISDNFRILERLDPGTYYIGVRGFSAFSVGAYTLTIQMENYIPFVCPDSKFNDPLYGCQWHLKATEQNGAALEEDINVESVWGTYKGNGIHIAVVDNGMHFAHEDLKENVDTALNHDYTPRTPSIYARNNNHGTAVSGLIAARDENGLGVRGVAPRATIYGYNLLDNNTAINQADAMTRNRVETVVSNNSWGAPDIVALIGPARVWEMAIETGVNEGSDGKGIVYVWAGGNGAEGGGNSNYDGYANYYAVTAVCAVSDQGIRSFYSEQGANLWVCAPSSDSGRGRQGIVTTDNAHRYIDDFSGTSAAAPIVSGVVALVRQANPELSWRDVKLVLAASARRNDPDNSGWQDGAVQYGAASERYTFNHEYGFGVVDAQAAVDLAQDWKNVPSMETAESTTLSVNQIIPDNSTTGITRSLQIASDIDFIEFVEINIDFNHPRFIDLDMRLISPSGAVSELMVYVPQAMQRGRLSVTGLWRFGSARHLGEDPSGIWQLAVVDRVAINEGTLDSWGLKIYGHSNPAVMIVFTEMPTEENLDGSTLVMTITDAVWSTPLEVADFSLAAAPAGVSIMGVERNTDTTATLTLEFDGTNFDNDMAISVTVLATAHSGTADLVSRLIIITANQEASGEPSITGTPQVGIPLAATIGSITDGNGLNTANYAWQWQVSTNRNTWTDIPGANTAEFMPALIHQDQFLRVVASFTDDDGFRESRTSTFVGLVSNDSFATATPIRLDVPINGEIHSGDDVDYFRIEIASTVDVNIFTEGTIDTLGGLYDGSLTFLTFNHNSGNDNNFLIRGPLYVDTYYIRVDGFPPFGAYTLIVQTDTSVVTDIHGDTTATATPISLDAPKTGELHLDDVDYFRIEVTTPVDVSIFTEGRIDTAGRLYDSLFTLLAFDDNPGLFRNFQILDRLEAETTYYIAVSGFSAFSVGAYTLTVQTDTSVVTDIHGDTTATATPISLGDSKTGEIHVGDVDYFRIEVTSTVDVSIFTEGRSDTAGRLYDSLFTLLALDDNPGIFRNFRILERLYPGTYYIEVRGVNAFFSFGPYTLTIQMEDTISFVCPVSDPASEFSLRPAVWLSVASEKYRAEWGCGRGRYQC